MSERDLNKSQKLVVLLDLLARRGGARAGELQERFDIDARTLRRYLDDLVELGIPVEDGERGEDRIVQLDPRYRRTGVQLTLTEALSLHFGRRLFDFLEGTSFASDLDDALDRLEPAIARGHADLVRQLDRRFQVVPEAGKSYRGEASEIIDDLVSAIVHNNPVEGAYRKAVGADVKRYLLHPYTLATWRRGLYLLAHDTAADAVKTFAVERFVTLSRRRGEHFEVPATWRPEQHLQDAFGIITGPPVTVELAFAPDVAGYIKERRWHGSQHIDVRDDGWLRLTLRVALTHELETWIRGFGADVRVLSPASLADRIREQLRSALARYEPTDRT